MHFAFRLKDSGALVRAFGLRRRFVEIAQRSILLSVAARTGRCAPWRRNPRSDGDTENIITRRMDMFESYCDPLQERKGVQHDPYSVTIPENLLRNRHVTCIMKP